jgi:hypothetical protein
MKLETIKIDFEDWARNHNLSVFYSDDSSSLPSIIYSDHNDPSLSEFKKLIIQTSPRLIIVIAKDMNFEKGCYESYTDWLKENDDNYEEHLSLLERHSHNIVALEIGFIYEGIYLFSLQSAEWHDDFEDIKKILLEINNDIDNQELSENKLPQIPKDEMNNLAREMAFNEEYIKGNNMMYRNDFVSRKAEIYFTEKQYLLDWATKNLLYTKTEDVFMEEVKPKRDLELKNQIAGLKAQGFKKVQIQSKLNISLGAINKVWEII